MNILAGAVVHLWAEVAVAAAAAAALVLTQKVVSQRAERRSTPKGCTPKGCSSAQTTSGPRRNPINILSLLLVLAGLVVFFWGGEGLLGHTDGVFDTCGTSRWNPFYFRSRYVS